MSKPGFLDISLYGLPQEEVIERIIIEESKKELKEIPDDAIPELPSKEKKDGNQSFTAGDQISLL